MKYFVQTKNTVIKYCRRDDEDSIEAFCDSGYGGDKETRGSTTGFVIFHGGGPISWC